MSQTFTEAIIEEVALVWLESLGYPAKLGPETALGGGIIAWHSEDVGL